MKKIHYALFLANPSSNPPFDIEIGLTDEKLPIRDCAHIPDAIEKFKQYISENNLNLSSDFTLIYPIFMEIMDTEYENQMHNIAWLIKNEADKNNWKFDRIGGYTGKTTDSFIK